MLRSYYSTGAFQSTLVLRGEVPEVTISSPKKWAKTSRRQDRHESKKVRGQAPGQEEAGRHTKEMRANEEEVKRARMGVAMDGCSRTAEDPPPPTVSRGDEEEKEEEESWIFYLFFFGCESESVDKPEPPTRFLPHRHEAVSALRGQGGAVCNPARGRDPLSPPPQPPPSFCLPGPEARPATLRGRPDE